MYFKFHDEDPQQYLQVKNKIDNVFYELRKSGFINEPKDEDVEHFKATGELYVDWRGNGKVVSEAFKKNGLRVVWNGKKNQRILVKC